MILVDADNLGLVLMFVRQCDLDLLAAIDHMIIRENQSLFV